MLVATAFLLSTARVLEDAAESIDAGDLRAHVRFLASDELQGRALGHPGNDAAALYLASHFERAALETEEGYFQRFGTLTSTLGPQSSLTDSEGNRSGVGDDFHPLHASASATVRARLLFAGYGITAPELAYDDYAGLDARDKLVVAMRHEPEEGEIGLRFAGRGTTVHALPERKVETARDHGAVGLILVPDSRAHPDEARSLDWKRYWPENPSPADEWYFASDDSRRELVSVMVSPALADRLSNDSEVTLAVDLNRRPLSARNVIGYLRGSDASLERELVILGAHFDHEGSDSTGAVYNGADDNASGTAAVLEVVEAFSRLGAAGLRPRRTVVFGLWNGEEKGRLGSRHYAGHAIPIGGRPVAYLNLDMIGRSEEVLDPSSSGFFGLERTTAVENANVVHMMGYSFAPDLARIVDERNQAIGLTLKKERDPEELGFIRSSDHWSFLERGIPAVFLYTGEHPQVHTPEDDIDRIDFEKMERIARLAFLVTWSLANPEGDPP